MKRPVVAVGDQFDEFMGRVDRRLNGGQDVVLMITGNRGSGKSSLAIPLGAYVDERFTLDQVCFNYPDYFKQMGSMGPGRAGIVDESTEGGRAQQWSNAINMQTDAVFSTNRKMHQLHMCLDLERSWFLRAIQNAAWRWIHITDDHIAQVAYDKNKNNKHRDAYWVDEFEFTFDPLPRHVEKAYLERARAYVNKLGGVRGVKALKQQRRNRERISPLELVNKASRKASLRTAHSLLEEVRQWDPREAKLTGKGVKRDDVIAEWSRTRAEH